MIDASSVVGPAAGPAPTPTDSSAPPAEGDSGIPPAVLDIPEFAPLLQGTPPAIWVPSSDKSDEVKTIAEHHKDLIDAGFGFYQSKDGKTNVIFNGQFTSPDEIKKMDAAGHLRDFATPLDELKQAVSGASGAPAAAPDASAPSTPASVAPAPPAASLDKKLATARVNNLSPGGPTSGPVPGQGRLLNSILRPTI